MYIKPSAHRGSDVEHDPLDERFELLLVKLHLGSHLCLPSWLCCREATVPGLRGASAKRARNLRESA